MKRSYTGSKRPFSQMITATGIGTGRKIGTGGGSGSGSGKEERNGNHRKNKTPLDTFLAQTNGQASSSAATFAPGSTSESTDLASPQKRRKEETAKQQPYQQPQQQEQKGGGGGGGNSDGSTHQSISFDELSDSQQQAYMKIKRAIEAREERKETRGEISLTGETQTECIFVTGQAGTGKTRLIQFIREKVPYAVCTALTGVAASLLGGGCKTLHSMATFGFGILDYPDELYLKQLETLVPWSYDADQGRIVKSDPSHPKYIMQVKSIRNRVEFIKNLRVLIVDEISLCSWRLFNLLGRALEICGIDPVIIVVGDFMQLPPVVTPLERERYKKWTGLTNMPVYCFQSQAWKSRNVTPCVLKTNFRQAKDDNQFLVFLEHVRIGHVTRGDEDFIWQRCVGPVVFRTNDDIVMGKMEEMPREFEDGILPTHIFSTHASKDEKNIQELEKLEGQERVFPVKITVHDARHPFLNAFLEESRKRFTDVVLKEGAQVMYIVNNERDELVNGSRGVVTGFDAKTGLPIVRFTNGKKIIVAKHNFGLAHARDRDRYSVDVISLPLMLAWALTIHKVQGCTLSRAYCDMNNMHSENMVYVMFSRTTFNGLYIANYNGNNIPVSKDALEYVKTFDDNDPCLNTERAAAAAEEGEATALERGE
jgi:hypothetical protein